MGRSTDTDVALYTPPTPIPGVDDETSDESRAAWPKAQRKPIPVTDVAQALLNAGTKARAARDSFRQVAVLLKRGDVEQADAAFADAKTQTIELWDYTHLRSSGFRSLLAAIDAGTRHKHVTDFDDGQIATLLHAYQDLPKTQLDQADVTNHIRQFAVAGVDVTAPIAESPKLAYRITVEKLP